MDVKYSPPYMGPVAQLAEQQNIYYSPHRTDSSYKADLWVGGSIPSWSPKDKGSSYNLAARCR